MVERLWTQPALTITGLDAPKVDGASNTLTPAARAKLSLRIAPGDTTENALARLTEHLEQHVPYGAALTVTVVDTGEATAIDATGPAYDAARAAFAEAWDGTAPVDMGVGGSIPFIAEFLGAFPEASVLVTGVEDPDTRAHGANEGLHLAEFEKVVLAEALLLRNLVSSTRSAPPRHAVGVDRDPRDPHPSPPRAHAAGRKTRNVLPRPRPESTSIRPPWRATTRAQIARPRPVPGSTVASGLVERKNSVKSCSWSSWAMPMPSSWHLEPHLRRRPGTRARRPRRRGGCTSRRCSPG